MRVHRVQTSSNQDVTFELLGDDDRPVAVVSGFMRHLRARGYSPNTLSAYAYDLLHFMTFLRQHQLTYEDFTLAQALAFLEYLHEVPSRTQARRLGLVLCTTDGDQPATRLSPPTINRTFAAVSSFYEYLILSGQFTQRENPFKREMTLRVLVSPTGITPLWVAPVDSDQCAVSCGSKPSNACLAR